MEQTDLTTTDSGFAGHDDQTVYDGIRNVLEQARRRAAAAVNSEMVIAYWEVGRRIHEAVGGRAEYGKRLIGYLSERLTAEFGRGFTVANLKNMRQFYCVYEKSYALRSELSWTHYRTLMRIDDPDKRAFYETAAISGCWSSRRLEREIHGLHYERLLATDREVPSRVGNHSEEPACIPSAAALDIKDPYVLDFLGLPEAASLHESDLEQAIIDHLQQNHDMAVVFICGRGGCIPWQRRQWQPSHTTATIAPPSRTRRCSRAEFT